MSYIPPPTVMIGPGKDGVIVNWKLLYHYCVEVRINLIIFSVSSPLVVVVPEVMKQQETLTLPQICSQEQQLNASAAGGGWVTGESVMMRLFDEYCD